jgi:hypothetical protein
MAESNFFAIGSEAADVDESNLSILKSFIITLILDIMEGSRHSKGHFEGSEPVGIRERLESL